MIELLLGDGPVEILCLGAHADDIEIGLGGTLLRLAHRPSTAVNGVVLSSSPRRADEARSALPRFFPGAEVEVHGVTDGRFPAEWDRVKQTLEDVAARTRPQVLFAPRGDDAHQDHRLIGDLVTTVWRDTLVLHYEIPKWDGDLRRMSHYVQLDEATARRKLSLLNESFPSQAGREWWDDEFFLGLLRLRGVEARSRFAEAFWCDKVVLGLGETSAP